jgi:hypothetical protein
MLRTIPHRRRMRIYGFELSGLGELATSLDWLNTWSGPSPDWFIGARRFRPGPEFTVAQYGFDLDEERPIDAFPLTPLASRRATWVQLHERIELRSHARTLDLVEGHPGCVRLWTDYMFGYEGFVQFARYIDERLRDSRFRAHLSVIGVLIHRSPATKISFPFEASSADLGLLKYMLGFYLFVPDRAAQEIERVRATLKELLARCLELGGRPYRYGIAELDPKQHEVLLGAATAEVSRALSRRGAS